MPATDGHSRTRALEEPAAPSWITQPIDEFLNHVIVKHFFRDRAARRTKKYSTLQVMLWWLPPRRTAGGNMAGSRAASAGDTSDKVLAFHGSNPPGDPNEPRRRGRPAFSESRVIR